MIKLKHGILLASAALTLGACSKSSETETTPSSSSQSVVSALATKLGTALESATGNTGLTVPPALAPLNTKKNNTAPIALAVDPFECNSHGWTDASSETDPNWAMKQLYCMMTTKSTGPDTLLGAINQLKGFVCAAGDVVFDGTEKTATMAISTACFSQEFVDMATTELGKSSIDIKVKGVDLVSSPVAGVSSEWEKMLQLDFQGQIGADKPGFTILIKDAATVKALAAYGGLLLNNNTNSTEAFSAFVDITNGKIAYEARIAPSEDRSFSRHLRLFLKGSVNESTLQVANVDDMALIWGDGPSLKTGGNASDYAMYATIKGTLASGRKVVAKYYQSSSWTVTQGDAECYGGTGTCGTGITEISAEANMNFFFQGTKGTDYTDSPTWFKESSYLGHFDIDLNMKDIQD